MVRAARPVVTVAMVAQALLSTNATLVKAITSQSQTKTSAAQASVA